MSAPPTPGTSQGKRYRPLIPRDMHGIVEAYMGPEGSRQLRDLLEECVMRIVPDKQDEDQVTAASTNNYSPGSATLSEELHKKKEVDDLRAENDALRVKIAKLDSEKESQHQVYEGLQTNSDEELRAQQARAGELEDQLRDVQRKLGEEQRRNQTLAQEKEALQQQQQSRVDEDKLKLEAEVKKLRAKLRSQQAENRIALQRVVDQEQQRYEKDRKERMAEIAALKTQMERAKEMEIRMKVFVEKVSALVGSPVDGRELLLQRGGLQELQTQLEEKLNEIEEIRARAEAAPVGVTLNEEAIQHIQAFLTVANIPGISAATATATPPVTPQARAPIVPLPNSTTTTTITPPVTPPSPRAPSPVPHSSSTSATTAPLNIVIPDPTQPMSVSDLKLFARQLTPPIQSARRKSGGDDGAEPSSSTSRDSSGPSVKTSNSQVPSTSTSSTPKRPFNEVVKRSLSPRPPQEPPAPKRGRSPSRSPSPSLLAEALEIEINPKIELAPVMEAASQDPFFEGNATPEQDSQEPNDIDHKFHQFPCPSPTPTEDASEAGRGGPSIVISTQGATPPVAATVEHEVALDADGAVTNNCKCGKTFKNWRGVRCHIGAKNKTGARKPQKFKGIRELQKKILRGKKHIPWSKSSVQGSWYCSCGSTFADRGKLNMHVQYITHDWKFKCDLCTPEKSFFYLTHLKKHMKKVHKIPNPLKEFSGGCHRCGEKFKTRKEFMTHLKAVHGEPFKAPVALNRKRRRGVTSSQPTLSQLTRMPGSSPARPSRPSTCSSPGPSTSTATTTTPVASTSSAATAAPRRSTATDDEPEISVVYEEIEVLYVADSAQEPKPSTSRKSQNWNALNSDSSSSNKKKVRL